MFALKIFAGFIIGFSFGRMAAQGHISHRLGLTLAITSSLLLCLVLDYIYAS